VDETNADDPTEQYTREQLVKMLEFTRMVTSWYGQVDQLSTPALLRLFRGGALLARLFTGGKSQTPKVASEQETADDVTSEEETGGRWRRSASSNSAPNLAPEE